MAATTDDQLDEALADKQVAIDALWDAARCLTDCDAALRAYAALRELNELE
jgi:hypothetical protein